MMSSCLLCLQPTQPTAWSVPCTACHQRTCITCESKFQRAVCAFCRTPLATWPDKLCHMDSFEQFASYCAAYDARREAELLQFAEARILFWGLLHNCPEAEARVQRLVCAPEDEPGDAEQLCTDLMLLARSCLYQTAYQVKDVDQIERLLHFVHCLRSSPVASLDAVPIDLDLVEDLLFADTDDDHALRFAWNPELAYRSLRAHKITQRRVGSLGATAYIQWVVNHCD